VVSRAELDAALNDPSRLERTNVVPSFKDGRANGFKLFGVRPGGAYAKLGIQNGDLDPRERSAAARPRVRPHVMTSGDPL